MIWILIVAVLVAVGVGVIVVSKIRRRFEAIEAVNRTLSRRSYPLDGELRELSDCMAAVAAAQEDFSGRLEKLEPPGDVREAVGGVPLRKRIARLQGGQRSCGATGTRLRLT